MENENYKKPLIIAEIGCNHKGDFDIAKELIDLAVESDADYAKFQKRNPRELLSKEQYDAPHPNIYHAYGDTYGEHRENLEFSLEQHTELLEYCKLKHIGYSTSVWDISSANEIISLEPDYIKIPSACNTNYHLLEILRDNYQGDIHISLGMTTRKEEAEIIEFMKIKPGTLDRVILYSCTSGYPVPFEDVALLEIKRIKNTYGHLIKDIGFSGHHLGIAIDNAAYTLGANIIERHFTKDRTWRGTDHAASLEPQGLKKLVRDLHATYHSLSYKSNEILEIEDVQRNKLKYKGIQK